jgi:hypothetical protein
LIPLAERDMCGEVPLGKRNLLTDFLALPAAIHSGYDASPSGWTRKSTLVQGGPPAMQTSAGVVFRAFIMLACLVAIPLVAVFGSSLPKIVGSVLEGRWPPDSGENKAAGPEKNAVVEPGQFEPTTPPGGIPAGPAEPITPLWQNDPLRDGLKWPAEPLDSPRSPVVPTGFESPLVDRSGPSASTNGPRAEPRLMAARTESLAEQAITADEQFKRIHTRLNELGATYYLLESWGNQRDCYRFYCQMSVGGNPSCSRPFQATHADPIQAMTQVLQQVEAWQSRHP